MKNYRIFYFILIFNACSSIPEPPITGLEGIWEEDFEWLSPWPGAIFVQPVDSFAVKRTCRITFYDSTFDLSILPAAPDWAFPDSVDAHGNFVDTNGWVYRTSTHYSGRFELHGDTLVCKLSRSRKPWYFTHHFYGGALHIFTVGEIDTTDIFSHPNFSFLWDFSMIKSLGEFGTVK